MFKVLVIILNAGIEILATWLIKQKMKIKVLMKEEFLNVHWSFIIKIILFTINNLENTGRYKERDKSSFIPQPLENSVMYFLSIFSVHMDMRCIFKQN